MGTGKRRQAAQLARDRKRIGELYLKGWLQVDIAAEINLSIATISRDIKALQKGWIESALVDFSKAKGRELAKVDHLERTYWDAWLRSQEDKETRIEESSKMDKAGRAKIQMKSEGQVGNPAFLTGVQWCIDKRCKILGLDAPTKVDLKVSELDNAIEFELEKLAASKQAPIPGAATGEERQP